MDFYPDSQKLKVKAVRDFDAKKLYSAGESKTMLSFNKDTSITVIS